MKRSLFLVIGILVCLVLVAGVYFWATSMIDSINAYRSPLKDNAPQPGMALGQPATQRVVVILVDGLRLDTSLDASVMPTLEQLRQSGASAVMHSTSPSYSEASWMTILTGAWPQINDGPALNLELGEIFTTTQNDIFTNARAAGLKTAISGYAWFGELLPQNAVDASFYTHGEDDAADRSVVEGAHPWLDDPSFGLVLIHLDQIDYAGHHEGGGASQAWNEAAARVDVMIAEILEKLDLEQDTLVLLSDHGHINLGGHGGAESVVTTEPFIMIGKAVKNGEFDDISMTDVAPTIAALLGTSLPASAQGHVLDHMLDLPAETTVNLAAAMNAQQTQLVNAYSTALNIPIPAGSLEKADTVQGYQAIMQRLYLTHLNQQRLPYMIISGVILAGLLCLAIVFWKKQMPWLLLGAVIYGVIFNLVYFFIGDLRYSFSTLSSPMGIILNTAIFGLLAFLPAWLAVGLITRQFVLKPVDAANRTLALTFTIIGVLAVPILVHVALDGILVTWTLPNFTLLYVGLICLIQVLIVAVVGLLFTGLTALTACMVRKIRKA